MFCPKCGNGLPDGVKFCGKCGTRIEGKSNVTIECNSVKPKTSMFQRRIRGKGILITLGIISIITISLLFLLTGKGHAVEDEIEVPAAVLPLRDEAQSIDSKKTEETGTDESFLMSNVAVGDEVEFGTYEQDNNLSNGKEPLKWIVLDIDGESGRALLISRYSIDVQPFDQYGIPWWGDCSLRSWLNQDFYQNAFASDEQQYILETELNNDENAEPQYCVSTYDKVFLLSMREINSYMNILKDALKTESVDEDLLSYNYYTDYAFNLQKEAYQQGSYALDYRWLRSGYGTNDMHGINISRNSKGYISDSGTQDLFAGDYCYVCPALWVGIASKQNASVAEDGEEVTVQDLSLAEVGDIIEFGKYEQNNVADGKEPIEWIIIDKQGNQLLLLSRKILDVGSFYDIRTNCTWSESRIRSWLNDDSSGFLANTEGIYDSARKEAYPVFSDIKSDHNEDGTIEYETTSDFLFLLSEKEANKYIKGKEEWVGEGTAYAIANGLCVDENNYSRWWQRSTEHIIFDEDIYVKAERQYLGLHGDSCNACLYSDYGYPEVSTSGKTMSLDVMDDDWGIRPAMWISVE